ncbi:MAG TPA: peptidase MA family metallohydrolase [Dehalococcoidales bacterium]
MIKKVVVLVSILCLALGLFSPGLVQAQAGLTVTGSSAKAEFPLKLVFSFSAKSAANIVDVRLRYKVERDSYAQVTSEVLVAFTPSTDVSASWTWDMRQTGGMPPGSTVEYWWTVKDARGDRVETAPVRLQFDDTRYSWQSLTEGMVTVYWYEGKQAFAQELMLAVQQALARLSQDTGAQLKKPVRLYIYASTRDLQGAMVFPQEWTGGAAYSDYGTIAIGISPSNLNWGKRAIAHELSHLVTYQMVFNPYNDLPTWLNEGLAVYTEGVLEVSFASSLKKAIANNSLISVRSLASPFSAISELATQSYAESFSIVEFLISQYGQDKMFTLFSTFRQGSGWDAALVKIYGFDMDGVDKLWREYVVKKYQ